MSEPDPRGASAGSYKWAVVAMLWLVCFFNYADRQAIYSVFEPIKEEMRLSDAQLGVVGASFMWVYAAAAPLAGFVGDRFRRKTLILGGLIFWSVICAATALSTKYWHLVLFRALEGFGEAFYFPASMSLVSSYHGEDTRSRAMAIHQSSVYAGTVAGGTLGGWMGQHHGWRSSFYLLGALGVILGLVLLKLLKDAPREADAARSAAPGSFRVWLRDFGESVREFFTNPVAVLLMGVFVGANFVAAIFLTWLPTFLKRKFDMSLALAGFSATLFYNAASAAGVLLGGVLADRFASRHRTGRMTTQALGLICGVPFIFLTGWTLSVPVLVIAMAGFGLFKGLYDANIWASLHDFVRPGRRASAVGFMNSMGWIGGSAAPIAVGVVSARYGMSAAISASSAVYLLVGLALVLGIVSLRRRR
ncbi:MAG TPA: MFS transporter [Planctomycetota bacterium]|nr:MFS transporter [Planctomycetota bacterium]